MSPAARVPDNRSRYLIACLDNRLCALLLNCEGCTFRPDVDGDYNLASLAQRQSSLLLLGR